MLAIDVCSCSVGDIMNDNHQTMLLASDEGGGKSGSLCTSILCSKKHNPWFVWPSLVSYRIPIFHRPPIATFC